MWVAFLRPFPGNEAHDFVSGDPKGGDQKVYVEKVYVLFRALKGTEKAHNFYQDKPSPPPPPPETS